MSRTHAHQPWKTTDYYKHDGDHNEKLWQKSKNRIRRQKADSAEVKRQNRANRHADTQRTHNLITTPEVEDNITFTSSARRDVYKWPSW